MSKLPSYLKYSHIIVRFNTYRELYEKFRDKVQLDAGSAMSRVFISFMCAVVNGDIKLSKTKAGKDLFTGYLSSTADPDIIRIQMKTRDRKILVNPTPIRHEDLIR
jgi:hypothetical protein